jgi:4-amino-4-deoxy-L-arabinose transferase-like glycosyltransferase
MQAKKKWIFPLFVTVGVLLRIAFVLAADSRQLTFLSGGSDAPVYDSLARNIIAHKGFTNAGTPTAFRPPGYPLLLAGFMEIFGQHYISAVRWLQCLAGLLTVWVCGRISRHLFDAEAEQATIVFGLFLPTLLFSTDQLLTECLAALLTAIFIWLMIRQQEKGDVRSACGLGFIAGVQAILRFNAAALPIFALWTALKSRQKPLISWRVAAILFLPLLLVLPWLVRNAIVFPGHLVYSTHTGAILVQGVVSPQGRTKPGETEKLQAAMGWSIQDLEQNPSWRLSMPDEVELNRQAIRVVPGLWRDQGWHAIPLLIRKVADFWLSTDQLFDTQLLGPRDRVVRVGGVLSYLLVLAFGLVGLRELHKIQPELATTFCVFAAGLTLLHLPMVMNTRLRIPLMDPLLVVLAGAGWTRLMQNRAKFASSVSEG